MSLGAPENKLCAHPPPPHQSIIYSVDVLVMPWPLYCTVSVCHCIASKQVCLCVLFTLPSSSACVSLIASPQSIRLYVTEPPPPDPPPYTLSTTTATTKQLFCQCVTAVYLSKNLCLCAVAQARNCVCESLYDPLIMDVCLLTLGVAY